MNKGQVLALLEELPDDFDADELAYILTLRQRLDRAEDDLAAGRLRSKPGEPPTPWEQHKARHERTVEVLTRVGNNTELIRRIAASEEARARGEPFGIPFRQILEEDKRRRRGHA